MDWSASLLSFLASVTARSLCLAALALATMLAFRVRTAAARHAVLTMTVLGTLLLAALAPLMPPIALRVLQPVPDAIDITATVGQVSDLPLAAPQITNPPPDPARALPTWQQVTASLYLLG